jgi:hypothetical protein
MKNNTLYNKKCYLLRKGKKSVLNLVNNNIFAINNRVRKLQYKQLMYGLILSCQATSVV